ncbi:MAG: bifunctional oligoribonuclease/PAP phosphatase NrnA [Oscillospiraceae bacterium]|nr:bifunctional oligoribonuclease/PAP phosphatase NrnA [Oscillospiraceae bacterium]MBQ8884001.1 bifunctional oligoribonuclease/PAP phosphatase NrnA [Oscillospiraceae bacterium]
MDFSKIKSFLESCDNVTILTHKSPDGDTLGAGFALCRYLRLQGKKANVVNSDEFPERYAFLYEGYEPMKFVEKTVIAVDIADTKLLGHNLEEYEKEGKIDLCIDHHVSNKYYAKYTYVNASASAACQIMYELFRFMDAEIDRIIARCLYTGIATDTGCFKYENTTSAAHIAVSELMKYNIDYATINRKMFDVKSRARIKIEQAVTNDMEFLFDGRCAVMVITTQMMEESGIEPAEFEGLASIPLQVEGVEMGITVKQRHENVYKLSVRTTETIDASKFCQQFGGGGHIRAAGCELNGTLDEVKKIIEDNASKLFGVK